MLVYCMLKKEAHIFIAKKKKIDIYEVNSMCDAHCRWNRDKILLFISLYRKEENSESKIDCGHLWACQFSAYNLQLWDWDLILDGPAMAVNGEWHNFRALRSGY